VRVLPHWRQAALTLPSISASGSALSRSWANIFTACMFIASSSTYAANLLNENHRAVVTDAT